LSYLTETPILRSTGEPHRSCEKRKFAAMRKDEARLAAQQADPRMVRLFRGLARLRSTLTVMQTGAHPDDEHNGLLAALRFRDGHRIVIACSTRGEGGQNALGPERGGALGVVRTCEMEQAARVIDADIHWLGHGPDDAVHDFGFSKNGDDTLARWGEDGIVERLVRAYRAERPDIVIPTFLDVPGQHGHHRAMTRAAETAIALAADPEAYPEHFAEGLAPWTVGKFYLPAWSGGGGTYDDEVPPPDATLVVSAPDPDPATGAVYGRIGEWSRRYHASQGMGYWKPAAQTEWPLHLEHGPAAAEKDIADNLPGTLVTIAKMDALPPDVRRALEAAHEEIEAAVAAFPKAQPILAALAAAANGIEAVRAQLPAPWRDTIDHRLARTLDDIGIALVEAAGLRPVAWMEPTELVPGGSGTLWVLPAPGTDPGAVAITPCGAPGLSFSRIEDEGDCLRFRVEAAPETPLTGLYPPLFSSRGGNGALFVKAEARIAERSVAISVDLQEPLHIRPPAFASLDPDAIIVPTTDDRRIWPVRARLEGKGTLTLAPDGGWQTTRAEGGFTLTALGHLAPGLVTLGAQIDGLQAFRRIGIAYPHIGETAYLAPEALRILTLDLALPKGALLGYIGGGADRVGTWLGRMGCDVTLLEPGALDQDLSRFTTLVVGIFAFGLRPDLLSAIARLHDWVEQGGHLVTLYHRPGDNWSPDTVPPRRLVIGSPSLRWRVTDPKADVTPLAPGHPLLTYPNAIGPSDWAGWDKERGLYFAAEWDDAYVPLLSMHDQGEQPLHGALVSAAIGRGRHTHTSLVLHHQLDRLVPGAFRLMANLVQPARA
jgi:LmbE family N-acetylglucosaminyl deacetylase